MRDFTCMVSKRTTTGKALRSAALLFGLLAFGGTTSAQTFKFLNVTYNVTSKTDPSVEVAPAQYSGDVSVPGLVQYNDTTWKVVGIGNSAFAEQGITSISLPNTIKYIANSAFYADANLTSITLPDSLESIGIESFISCVALPSINIPATVKSIGSRAFVGCQKLAEVNVDAANENYSSEDGVLFDKDKTNLIYFPQARGGNYTIPSSVKEITSQAFFGSGITGVTIPEGVETIGSSAFTSTQLQTVTIPSTVKGALDATFSFCPNLTSVTINSNQITRIGGNAFYPDNRLTSVNIPSSVKTIGRSAFGFCSSLPSLTIPDGVDTIGDLAFIGCSSLPSLTLPTSVRTIGEQAFSQCSSFTEFTIPEGVTTLGTRAFENCYNLRTVNFPSTLSNIADGLFGNDNALASINFAEGNTSYSSYEGVIYNADRTKLVMTPPAYQGAINVPEGVTEINESGVRECAGVTSVTLPQSLTRIGDLAFYMDRGLKTISIPSKVTYIGHSAFADTGLDTLYSYAQEPPTIDDYTFYDLGLWNEGKVLYVPDTASVAKYRASFYWSLWHEILPMSETTDGISKISTTGNNIISEEYFDLSGRKVGNDAKGILIRRIKTSDGKTQTSKTFK